MGGRDPGSRSSEVLDAVLPNVDRFKNELASTLQTGVFRVGSGYQPIPLESLSDAERRALPERADEAGCAGILRPIPGLASTSGLVVKSADAETFGLLEVLKRPAKLPKEALASPRFVVAMVLDGILEIAHNGTFICGPVAARDVFQAPPRREPKGVIGALSRRAFDHALRLGVVESSLITQVLYRYNTIPASPRWLENMNNVSALLGLTDDGGMAKVLSAEWDAVQDESTLGGWMFWRSKSPLTVPRFKLYVSPGPIGVRDAFAALVTVLTEAGPVDFKVGRDAFGLLRPDKIVAYFETLSHLRLVAKRVAGMLEGCPVQGVPFTAELGTEGLLSWGADPRVTASTYVWGGPQSWRLWLTQRLSAAMTTALSLDPDNNPWDFVNFRMSVDGVVPDTWTPSLSIWDEEV